MGTLKYSYKCDECNKEYASYFNTRLECPHCGSLKITHFDISYLNIDKFSEEGQRLTKIKKEGKNES